MEYSKLELPAGEGQLIVVYVNQDTGQPIDVGVIGNEIAADSALRLAAGWNLRSVATAPMRQMGTTGNILFQSGGQYATQVGWLVVYGRD
jgi:hypothetical protein